MTREELSALNPGDIVRHVNDAEAYIVVANYGSHVTAIRATELTNPPEWDLIFKAELKPRK